MSVPTSPLSSAAELLAWLASVPPADRDGAIEQRFGIAADPRDGEFARSPDRSTPEATLPGEDLIGYHASGVAPILRALLEVPVVRDDVFIDLGSGLGKVVLLTALLTGATARGVELQPALVDRARQAAARLELDVRFDVGDAREADLDEGTVFFLYLPFTGKALSAVLDRLRSVAERRAIVVCALGVDLDRARWLARRELDEFWLAIYDSVIPGAHPRRCGAGE